MKICALLLFLTPSAMAAHPFAPYFGVWTGTGSNGQVETNLNVSIRQLGSMIAGNFNSVPKRGGKAYSGTFKGKAQEDGCYNVIVSVMGQPQGLEATACLLEDNSIEVSSMLSNGTITPSNKFTRCAFEFSTLISKATGTLYKKGAAKPKKKRAARRTAEE